MWRRMVTGFIAWGISAVGATWVDDTVSLLSRRVHNAKLDGIVMDNQTHLGETFANSITSLAGDIGFNDVHATGNSILTQRYQKSMIRFHQDFLNREWDSLMANTTDLKFTHSKAMDHLMVKLFPIVCSTRFLLDNAAAATMAGGSMFFLAHGNKRCQKNPTACVRMSFKLLEALVSFGNHLLENKVCESAGKISDKHVVTEEEFVKLVNGEAEFATALCDQNAMSFVSAGVATIAAYLSFPTGICGSNYSPDDYNTECWLDALQNGPGFVSDLLSLSTISPGSRQDHSAALQGIFRTFCNSKPSDNVDQCVTETANSVAKGALAFSKGFAAASKALAITNACFKEMACFSNEVNLAGSAIDSIINLVPLLGQASTRRTCKDLAARTKAQAAATLGSEYNERGEHQSLLKSFFAYSDALKAEAASNKATTKDKDNRAKQVLVAAWEMGGWDDPFYSPWHVFSSEETSKMIDDMRHAYDTSSDDEKSRWADSEQLLQILRQIPIAVNVLKRNNDFAGARRAWELKQTILEQRWKDITQQFDEDDRTLLEQRWENIKQQFDKDDQPADRDLLAKRLRLLECAKARKEAAQGIYDVLDSATEKDVEAIALAAYEVLKAGKDYVNANMVSDRNLNSDLANDLCIIADRAMARRKDANSFLEQRSDLGRQQSLKVLYVDVAEKARDIAKLRASTEKTNGASNEDVRKAYITYATLAREVCESLREAYPIFENGVEDKIEDKVAAAVIAKDAAEDAFQERQQPVGGEVENTDLAFSAMKAAIHARDENMKLNTADRARARLVHDADKFAKRAWSAVQAEVVVQTGDETARVVDLRRISKDVAKAWMEAAMEAATFSRDSDKEEEEEEEDQPGSSLDRDGDDPKWDSEMAVAEHASDVAQLALKVVREPIATDSVVVVSEEPVAIAAVKAATYFNTLAEKSNRPENTKLISKSRAHLSLAEWAVSDIAARKTTLGGTQAERELSAQQAYIKADQALSAVETAATDGAFSDNVMGYDLSEVEEIRVQAADLIVVAQIDLGKQLDSAIKARKVAEESWERKYETSSDWSEIADAAQDAYEAAKVVTERLEALAPVDPNADVREKADRAEREYDSVKTQRTFAERVFEAVDNENAADPVAKATVARVVLTDARYAVGKVIRQIALQPTTLEHRLNFQKAALEYSRVAQVAFQKVKATGNTVDQFSVASDALIAADVGCVAVVQMNFEDVDWSDLKVPIDWSRQVNWQGGTRDRTSDITAAEASREAAENLLASVNEMSPLDIDKKMEASEKLAIRASRVVSIIEYWADLYRARLGKEPPVPERIELADATMKSWACAKGHLAVVEQFVQEREDGQPGGKVRIVEVASDVRVAALIARTRAVNDVGRVAWDAAQDLVMYTSKLQEATPGDPEVRVSAQEAATAYEQLITDYFTDDTGAVTWTNEERINVAIQARDAFVVWRDNEANINKFNSEQVALLAARMAIRALEAVKTWDPTNKAQIAQSAAEAAVIGSYLVNDEALDRDTAAEYAAVARDTAISAWSASKEAGGSDEELSQLAKEALKLATLAETKALGDDKADAFVKTVSIAHTYFETVRNANPSDFDLVAEVAAEVLPPSVDSMSSLSLQLADEKSVVQMVRDAAMERLKAREELMLKEEDEDRKRDLLEVTIEAADDARRWAEQEKNVLKREGDSSVLADGFTPYIGSLKQVWELAAKVTDLKKDRYEGLYDAEQRSRADNSENQYTIYKDLVSYAGSLKTAKDAAEAFREESAMAVDSDTDERLSQASKELQALCQVSDKLRVEPGEFC